MALGLGKLKIMSSLSASEYHRPCLDVPQGAKKVLMHSCCAPCAIEVMEAIIASQVDLVVYFYNPNIHPRKEYDLRKLENQRFCQKRKIPFVDADYDKDNWFERIKGLEWEPERGKRCSLCFDMRFERTALYGAENGFSVITSSLGISRWKDMNQINRCGVKAVSRYEGMVYWTINWRKKGGSARMIELSKEENFYQQQYCGCVYSLRDTNRWRLSRGKEKINLGEDFYLPKDKSD